MLRARVLQLSRADRSLPLVVSCLSWPQLGIMTEEWKGRNFVHKWVGSPVLLYKLHSVRASAAYQDARLQFVSCNRLPHDFNFATYLRRCIRQVHKRATPRTRSFPEGLSHFCIDPFSCVYPPLYPTLPGLRRPPSHTLGHLVSRLHVSTVGPLRTDLIYTPRASRIFRREARARRRSLVIVVFLSVSLRFRLGG